MSTSQKLLTCSENVRVWELASCSLLHQFSHPTAKSFVTVAWDTDDRFMCVPAEERKLIMFDVFQNDINKREFDIGLDVSAVCSQHKSSHVAVGTTSGELVCWDTKQERIVKTIAEVSSGVTSVEYSLTDSHVAAGCVNGKVSIFNATSGVSSSTLKQEDTFSVRSLHFHQSNRFLLGSSYDGGQVTLWDIKKSALYLSLPEKHKAPATDLKFSPLGNSVVASVGLDKRILVHDMRLKKVVNNIRCDVPLRTLEFLPGGVNLVVGGSKGMVYVYDLRTTSAINSFMAHSKQVNKVSVSGLRSCKPRKKQDVKLRSTRSSTGSNVEPKVCRKDSVTSLLTDEEDIFSSPVAVQSLELSADFRKQVLSSRCAVSPLENLIQEGSPVSCNSPVVKNVPVDANVSVISALPPMVSDDKENIPSPAKSRKCEPLGVERETVAMETEGSCSPTLDPPFLKELLPQDENYQKILENLQDSRHSLHMEISTMFFQMLKHFTALQLQIQDVQAKCEANRNLVEEVLFLREENKRLRTTK